MDEPYGFVLFSTHKPVYHSLYRKFNLFLSATLINLLFVKAQKLNVLRYFKIYDLSLIGTASITLILNSLSLT